MLERSASRLLRRRLAEYPAVALTGPRQSGKTTLAHSLRGRYFDLEQESERLRLDLEWSSRIRGRELIVLDEAQSWPEVFPRIRGAIDEERGRAGRFLLLGSVAPSLMTRVSQSLAGRLSVVELTPLLWGELPGATARGRMWLCGGYPEGGVLSPRRFPRWQLDYVGLLAQRDLPAWGLPARPQLIQRLMRMLAVLQGQILNASQIGASLGISYHTVNSYLDYLEGAYLIRRLAPFEANLRKRLVKSPKVFWRDTGIAHALLNVAGPNDLLHQPWIGASWEAFVVEQILGVASTLGVPHEAFFLRTSDGNEIDLVLKVPRETWAIEIKLTSSPSVSDLARLNRAADWIHADRRFLLTQTSLPSGSGREASCNLPWLLERIPKWLRREDEAGGPARARRSQPKIRARSPARAG